MNRFASTVIYVPDNAKAVLDFYERAFGLDIKFYDPELDFGELDTGETTIAIAPHSTGKVMVGDSYAAESDGFPKNVELAFFSDDVEKAYATAIEHGCVSLCEPKVTPWGHTVAYVKSVEGTLVCLARNPAERQDA